MNRKISGVIAAVPTPVTSSFQPDVDLFIEHCTWALENGCDGLNILGTTGEANSLDNLSRESIMRASAHADFGTKALMVGTGATSLAETIKFTNLAADLDFDAALILPPFYYKPASDDGLFDYFSAVIQSVEQKEIAIYLYNFPQMTGIEFSINLVRRLIEAFPRHMRGMKDSSGNFDYAYNMAAAFKGQFDVFPSSEGFLADARKDGFAGCISASVNVTAPLAQKVWSAAGSASGEDCQELSLLRQEIASIPIVAAVKTLVALRSGNPSWSRMIPPLTKLSDSNLDKARSIAEKLGYL